MVGVKAVGLSPGCMTRGTRGRILSGFTAITLALKFSVGLAVSAASRRALKIYHRSAILSTRFKPGNLVRRRAVSRFRHPHDLDFPPRN